MKWKAGRQGSGYFKLTLFSSQWLKCDCHVIRLPKGARVPPHRDPCPDGWEHHRINLTLRAARQGGITFCERPPHPRTRIYRFRPDLVYHWVTAVREGSLWLLSVGWLTRIK